jgi:hypothetical protein
MQGTLAENPPKNASLNYKNIQEFTKPANQGESSPQSVGSLRTAAPGKFGGKPLNQG